MDHRCSTQPFQYHHGRRTTRPMEQAQIFQYEAFPSSLTVSLPFRVLHLLPGTGRDALAGEVHQARFDSVPDIPTYEALSYCCGDASEVARISIGSAAYLPLGHNLHEALLQLRLPDATRALWIDAICINQNDLDERAREVRLMHHVYQHAHRVLIWLDEPAVEMAYWNPQLAFNMASKLAELSETRPDINVHAVGRVRKTIMHYKTGIGRRQTSRVGMQRAPDALRLLFTRPWFERMWVVQEAICATDAMVMCGRQSIRFQTLMRAVEYGLRSGLFAAYRQRKILLPIQIGASASNISAAMAMYSLNSQTFSEDGSDGLLSLLRRFHGSKSFDPRDKLFALYGISALDHMSHFAKEFAAMKIVPDYHVDPVDLYVKVAKGILQRSGNLDLLSVPRSRSDGDKGQVEGLPSWVPDWSTVNSDTASLSYAPPTRYSASGSSTSTLTFNPTDDNLNTLTLSGHFIDRIVEVGHRGLESTSIKIFHDPSSGSPPVTILLTLELWARQAVDWEFTCAQYPKPGVYVTGEDMVDVYWALLLAARNQFENQWYTKDQVNHDIRQGRWSKWCADQLDKCSRFRHRRFRGLYYTVLFFSLFLRGMRRFGLYDEAIIRSRTIARTEKAFLALVPADTQPGDDWVALCRGGRVPLILRSYRQDDVHRLRLVGDAYVHGVMDGESWDESKCIPIILS